MNVDDITQEILRSEGGYVNDPDDPGGATNFGVTIGTMRALGLDLTGDNRVTVDDVKALTIEQAADIFEREYYRAPRISDLPEPVQPTVYDMQVNAGSRAVKILQELLNMSGLIVPPLAVDGVIGAMTIRAAHRAFDEMGAFMVDAYSIERRNFYFRLADGRVQSRKYARTRAGGKGGWITRAEKFMRPEYRMTRKEFDARVRDWG